MESNMDYHLPITPVGPAPSLQSKLPSPVYRRKKVWLYTALICIITALALGLIAKIIHKRHIDNDSEVIIQALEKSNAIQMRIQIKRSSLSSTSSDANVSAYLMASRDQPENPLNIDGRLSYTSGDLRYHFLLQNRRGYMTIFNTTSDTEVSAGCLDVSQIPPLDTIEQVLRDGQVIDQVAEFDENENASILDNDCSEDVMKRIEITFAGEHYIICKPRDDQNTMYHVYGEDISMEFHFLTPEDMLEAHSALPNVVSAYSATNSDTKVRDCMPLVDSPRAKPQRILRSMQHQASRWYEVLISRRRRLSSFLPLNGGEPQCTQGVRPCLFIHGIGVQESAPTSNSSAYFGTIDQQAPCCSETKFVQIDTVTQSWFDPAIEDRLCDEALDLSSGTSSEIQNMTVVSHSMGNLMFANAINSGKCSIASSVKWISLAGPFSGSKTADMLINRCNGDDGGEWDNVPDFLVSLTGKCPAAQSYYTLVLQDGNYSMSELDGKYQAAQDTYVNYVSSALCGISGSGLASSSSFGLNLVASLTGHSSANDGVVEINSCQKGLDKDWQASYQSEFYQPSINHLDATFRHDDGWWGENRKPVKWFQSQM